MASGVVRLTPNPGSRQVVGSRGLMAELPDKYDREAVETAVQVFLRSGWDSSRDVMCMTVEKFLSRYHLARMTFSDFTVERLRKGGIRIYARRVATDKNCPDCGCYIYDKDPVRLINIRGTGRTDDKGWYTYGCSCGAIFRRKEGDEV